MNFINVVCTLLVLSEAPFILIIAKKNVLGGKGNMSHDLDICHVTALSSYEQTLFATLCREHTADSTLHFAIY